MSKKILNYVLKVLYEVLEGYYAFNQHEVLK